MAQVTHVRATYNYTYEYEGSKISFKKDDEFQLLAKSNSDWWHVRRWNKEGLAQDIYVPAVYVKEVKVVKIETTTPTYENLAELQRKILMSKDKSSSNGSSAVIPDKASKRDQPTLLSKPRRNSSKKLHSGSGSGNSSPPAAANQQQNSISEDGNSKTNGLSSSDGMTTSLLQRLNQRQGPISKKDNIQVAPETSPKPRSKSVNEPKGIISPEDTEPNRGAEIASPTRQAGGARAKVPPPVLPKLPKPSRDRPKSMVVTSPTGGPESGVSAMGPGSLAEKIAAVSAQLQHGAASGVKKVPVDHEQSSVSKSVGFRRTLSPQTSHSDVLENKVSFGVEEEVGLLLLKP